MLEKFKSRGASLKSSSTNLRQNNNNSVERYRKNSDANGAINLDEQITQLLNGTNDDDSKNRFPSGNDSNKTAPTPNDKIDAVQLDIIQTNSAMASGKNSNRDENNNDIGDIGTLESVSKRSDNLMSRKPLMVYKSHQTIGDKADLEANSNKRDFEDQQSNKEAVEFIPSHDNHIKPSATLFLAAFGAVLGGLSMGLALGYTAPAFPDMAKTSDDEQPILDPDERKRELQKSLIGSTLAIGALLASLASEPLNKLFGRRLPLVFSGIPFVIGWISIALANNITMLVLGRLLIGVSCGVACSIAPTYVVEIAPPQIRGALGTSFQLMVVVGNLLESIMGMFLPWRSLAAWSLLPAIGMSTIMIFMPESPSWLLGRKREDDAKRALARLRTTTVDDELNVMIKASSTQGSSDYSWEMITSKEFLKPLLFAFGLTSFGQFTGINAVLMYQSDIFKKASPNSDALMSTIWVCLAQVIATVSCSFLVDRLGRKILLWISGAGDMATLIVFGTYSYLAAEDKIFQEQYSMVPLISLILFIIFFSFGFGPIPWMMVPELSSSRVRSLVASFGACFAWTGAYIVTASMKPLIGMVGDAWTYWILAIICALSCIFIFVLPETKVSSDPSHKRNDQNASTNSSSELAKF